MGYAREMVETSPGATPVDTGVLAECIEACFDCAQTCAACADACLGEENRDELVRCIRLNLDCADVCETTGRILSRKAAFDPAIARSMVEACSQACNECGTECERHSGHMEHCRICAEACRRCEEACNAVAAALPA